jgi:hypothetical protein
MVRCTVMRSCLICSEPRASEQNLGAISEMSRIGTCALSQISQIVQGNQSIYPTRN